MRFEIEDMQQGYVDVCQWVRDAGDEVSPRGMTTREVLDAVIVLADPAKALPIGCGRKPSSAIAAVEALQLIAGESRPRLMVAANERFKDFMDDGKFHGAYGPRVRSQMVPTILRLVDDPDTRQAVVTIWDRLTDCRRAGDQPKDMPCTVMLQFLIRDRKLTLHTTMRSNDVWWGLAYDAFQFTQLQIAVANALNMDAGPYYHHAVSLHAYERDWDAIDRLEAEAKKPNWEMFRPGVGARGKIWTLTSDRASQLMVDDLVNMNPTETWMADKVRGLL